jgi:hypothetical protein
MAQIAIDLTDPQQARVLKVYGQQSSLGRDATSAEVATILKAMLKDTVMAVETNNAIQQAGSSVLPWE